MVMAQMPGWLRRKLAEVRRMATSVVSRAAVNLTQDESGVATLQATLRAGETRDQIEHFEPYGFTARAPGAAQAVVLAVGGDRNHCIALGVHAPGTRFRGPDGAGMPKGESAQYGAELQRVRCKSGGGIEAVPADAGFVDLGAENPTDFAALASLVKAELQAQRNWLLGHGHVFGTLVDSNGLPCAGATGAPSSAPPAIGDVAAEKVRVK